MVLALNLVLVSLINCVGCFKLLTTFLDPINKASMAALFFSGGPGNSPMRGVVGDSNYLQLALYVLKFHFLKGGRAL